MELLSFVSNKEAYRNLLGPLSNYFKDLEITACLDWEKAPKALGIIVELGNLDLLVTLRDFKVPHILIVSKENQNLWSDKISQYVHNCAHLHGIVVIEEDVHLSFPLFKNFIHYLRHPRDLSVLDREVQQTLSLLKEEMKKIKRIHEYFIPRKIQNFNGIVVGQKYSVGEGLGSEFIDTIKVGKDLFLLIFSSDGFQKSVQVIEGYGKLKRKKKITFDDINKFYNEYKDKVQLIVGSLDLRTLEYKLFNNGNFLLSQFSNFQKFKNGLHQGRLIRNQKILILSPGVSINANINEFSSQLNFSDKDILDEIFIELKKNTIGPFLKFDATAICIEVENNVLVEA